MVLSAEALVADVTRVRSLVGVRALVNEQVVRLAEVTRTEATDVLFLGPRILCKPHFPFYLINTDLRNDMIHFFNSENKHDDTARIPRNN